MTATTPEPKPRCTKLKFHARTEQAVRLLCLGADATRVQAVLCEKYHITRRQARNYLALAREALQAGTARPLDELRAKSLGFYQSILADADVPIAVKIQARRYADELLGLQLPRRVTLLSRDRAEDWAEPENGK